MTTLVQRAVSGVKGGLAALLRDTGKGQTLATALLAEQETDRLEVRRSSVDEDDALHARDRALVQTHDDAERTARAEIDRLQAAIRAVQEQYAAVAGPIRLERLDIDRRRGAIAFELERTASPLIAAFIAEMDAEMKATAVIQHAAHTEYHHGRGGMVTLWSNTPSIRRRERAITEATRAARALTYDAIDDAELTARLDDLRQSLPAVEERPAEYCYGGHDAA